MNEIIESIHRLHASAADPQARRTADAHLKEFQASPAAWTFCTSILQSADSATSSDLTVRLFAAQTLKHKIHADIHELSSAQVSELQSALILMLTSSRSGGGSRLVLTQLSICLASVLVHSFTSASTSSTSNARWMDAFGAVFGALSSAGDSPALLLFLTVLPDECMGSAVTSENESQNLLAGCGDQLMQFLFSPSASSGAVLAESKLGLECIYAWVRAGLVDTALMLRFPLIQLAFGSLRRALSSSSSAAAASSGDDIDFDGAADLLCELARELKYSSTSSSSSSQAGNLLPLFYEHLQSVASSPLLAVSAAVDGVQDDDDVELRWKSLTRIYVHVGELFLPFILQQPLDLSWVVDAILKCTALPDLDIVPMTFNFWSDLASGLCGRSSSSAADSPSADSDALVAGDVVVRPPVPEVLRVAFVRLLEVMIGHLKYPNDLNTWSASERDDFRDFRHVMGDVLKDCCMVIGAEESLLKPLALMQHYSAGASVAGGWQPLEAALFALRALGSEIRSKDAPASLGVIMDMIFSMPLHPKIQYASTLVIGRYSEWTRHNPSFIPRQLDYISKGFSNSEIVAASSLALKFLCESCGELMIPYLEQLHPFYVESQSRLSAHDLMELTSAMAHIINSMQPSDIGGALDLFTQPLLQELTAIVSSVKSDSSQVVVKTTARRIDNLLGRFNVFMKHVNPPSLAHIAHPCVQAFAHVWPLLEQCCSSVPHEVTYEAVCRTIKTMIVGLYQHLHEALPHILAFLTRTYERSKCSVFHWCSSFAVRKFSNSSSENAKNMRVQISKFYSDMLRLSFTHFNADPSSLDADPAAFEDFIHFYNSIFRYVNGTPPLLVPFEQEFIQALLELSITRALVHSHYLIHETALFAIRDLLDALVSAASSSLLSVDVQNGAMNVVGHYAPALIGRLLAGVMCMTNSKDSVSFAPGMNTEIASIFISLSVIITQDQVLLLLSDQLLALGNASNASGGGAGEPKITPVVVQRFLDAARESMNSRSGSSLKFGLATVGALFRPRRRVNRQAA